MLVLKYVASYIITGTYNICGILIFTLDDLPDVCLDLTFYHYHHHVASSYR